MCKAEVIGGGLGRVRLHEGLYKEIEAMVSDGMSYSQIGRVYGQSSNHIGAFLSRWRKKFGSPEPTPLSTLLLRKPTSEWPAVIEEYKRDCG